MVRLVTDLIAEAGVPVDRMPATLEEAERCEEALENELANLSMVDHEQALFAVHGIQSTLEYDPPNLDSLLIEFEEDIQTKVSKLRVEAHLQEGNGETESTITAYEQAVRWNKQGVTNRAFRLMFLRAEQFDVSKASDRMLLHFDIKKEIFGDGELLGRTICYSDLNANDVVCLESGFTQIMPERDAAGRAVVCVIPGRKADKDLLNVQRAVFYQLYCLQQDEDTQKNGFILIFYCCGQVRSAMEFDFMKEVHRVKEGVPKRLIAGHFCYDDQALKPFAAGLHACLEKNARSRFKTHFGKLEEINFTLQTLGIPTQYCPILPDGTFTTKWLIKSLEGHYAQEDEHILLPRRFDVLFGRDKEAREHVGNLRAIHIVEMNRPKYEQAGKFAKTDIAERIVKIIHESHGRFLRRDKMAGGWVVVSDEVAREKVSHFFRHLRSQQKLPPTPITPQSDSASRKRNASVKKMESLDEQAEPHREESKRVTPSSSPIHA